MSLFKLVLRRINTSKTLISFPIYQSHTTPTRLFSSIPTQSCDSTTQSSSTPNPSSLSARMSFLFDQIDQIDKQRDEKHETLQRIRSWRQSNNNQDEQSPNSDSPIEELKTELAKSEALLAKKKEEVVELVHPWAEWVELIERLVHQNYFDHKRKDEDGMMEGLGLDLSDANSVEGDGGKGIDFARDFRSVQNAMVNFGKDRFDILRSLSRQDLQILVGYGCPSADKKVAYSCKLLRKHVHLDEGDVCSSCSLRSSCEKAYLLTNKEDEARTIDVMRLLLAYGFDPIDGSVVNKSVLKIKSVKTIVRKLLHEVVKLSAVPIDPNLPPPVIKKPPPKVKQPPPTPKRRVGRNDIEMKKGDWLCPKCDFMNFAKNSVCLQCDAKRPKRQLLPGEWECPQCNFLNYRRNTVCFHCEHNRPPDTYAPTQFPDNQNNPRIRTDKTPNKAEVSNAWNFDFDDNESDGADVAAFEFADSQKLGNDFSLGKQTLGENSRSHGDGLRMSSHPPRFSEREYSDPDPTRRGIGFNDFDEEDEDDVDSYELVSQNEVPKTSRIDFSDLEIDSEPDDEENPAESRHPRGKISPRTRNTRSSPRKASFSHSEDEVDFDSDDDLPVHPKWKSSHVADSKRQKRDRAPMRFVSDDDDLGFSSGADDETFTSTNKGNRRGSNRVDRVSRGRSRPSTDSDSDDDFSYNRRDKQGGRGHSGKASMGRGGGRTGFNRSSGFQRDSGGSRENFRDRPAKSARTSNSSNFRSRRGESSDRRGGRSKNFDSRSESFPDGEMNLRPRQNVR